MTDPIWRPFTQAKSAPPLPMAVRGEGAWIIDATGRRTLDLVSSWWVNLHGHAHPAIVQAIAEQAGRLEQVIFAEFSHEPAVRLATRLVDHLPGELSRVFFSDDGSTAVEVAIKMAHQFWRNKGEARNRVLGFEGGYHGDTVGAMSAGRSSGFFDAWNDLLFPVDVAPFAATWDGDPKVEAKEQAALAELDRILGAEGHRLSVAVIEPLVQGAGGMRMCRPEYLRAVADRVRAAGALLAFDEVMTGFGRTGTLFACLKAGVTPDLICLSKGLTGGFLAMAVTVASQTVWNAFLGDGIDQAFLHGHSYTANPLGCAAGLASLDLLESKATQDRIAAIERIHRQRLGALRSALHPRVTGTIAAFEVAGAGGYGNAETKRLKQALFEHGLLLRPLGNTLYLLPPYCITDDELNTAWDVIARLALGG